MRTFSFLAEDCRKSTKEARAGPPQAPKSAETGLGLSHSFSNILQSNELFDICLLICIMNLLDMNDYRSQGDQILFVLSPPNYNILIRNFGRIIFLESRSEKIISTKTNYLNFYKFRGVGFWGGGVNEVGG